MHRTRRDVRLFSHVRLAMRRLNEHRSETAHAGHGVQDGRAGSAEMARWENEGGALEEPKNGKRLIGVDNASSP